MVHFAFDCPVKKSEDLWPTGWEAHLFFQGKVMTFSFCDYIPKSKKMVVLFFSFYQKKKKKTGTGKFLPQLFVYMVTLEVREENNWKKKILCAQNQCRVGLIAVLLIVMYFSPSPGCACETCQR